MQDNDEDVPQKPQDSKCFTCKHGMVLHDNDLQTFVQPGVVPGNAFAGEEDQPGFQQMSVDMNKIRSTCFWRPKTANQSVFSPLVFNVVKECSRYERD